MANYSPKQISTARSLAEKHHKIREGLKRSNVRIRTSEGGVQDYLGKNLFDYSGKTYDSVGRRQTEILRQKPPLVVKNKEKNRYVVTPGSLYSPKYFEGRKV